MVGRRVIGGFHFSGPTIWRDILKYIYCRIKDTFVLSVVRRLIDWIILRLTRGFTLGLRIRRSYICVFIVARSLIIRAIW